MTADSSCLQGILHSICEASVRDLRDDGLVICNSIFSDRIVNIAAAGLLRQTVPLIRPVVGGIQLNRLFLRTIGQQVDCHAGGTIAVSVIAVFPNLGHIDLSLFSCMCICHGVREGSVGSLCNRRRVIGYRVFSNRVVNSGTVGLLVQTRPGMCPAIASVQFDRINLCAVFQQVDHDTERTIAILVVGIFPNLRNRNLGLFRRMAVGQGSDCSILISVCQRITRGQVLFTPGIGDQLSFVILRKMINSRRPVIRGVQRNGTNLGRTVHKVNCQAVRTDTILVVRIRPFLGDCSGSLFFSIGNGHLTGAVSAVRIASSTDCGSFYYIIGKVVDRSVCII